MTEQDAQLAPGSLPMEYYRRTERTAGVVVHPDFGLHVTGEHPENQQKVDRIADVLFAMPWADRLMRFYPRYARPEQIALVHDERYIRLIETASHAGAGWMDTDTRIGPGSYDIALLAAGGVMSAVDHVMMEAYHRPDSVFCIVRPPGHHAYAGRAMGFCLFNNVAIATRYAQAEFGLERVMIIDWDVHHGNGTAEIFAEDPSVLFVSMHQWPLYPGLGWYTEVGRGAGAGKNVNIPVPPGAGDAMYGAIFDRIITPLADQFRPELILVSAGQDCHCSDPLSDINVTYAGFQMMELAVRDLADRHCAGRHVLALEGGYNQHTLPYTVSAIIAAMADLPWEIEDGLAPEQDQLTDAQARRVEEVITELTPYWTF
jgi:acetoin utilization deacetylase AcuC-like enzyme